MAHLGNYWGTDIDKLLLQKNSGGNVKSWKDLTIERNRKHRFGLNILQVALESETYLETCRTSKMEPFAKIVNDWKLLFPQEAPL